jgi:hypothetical protein
MRERLAGWDVEEKRKIRTPAENRFEPRITNLYIYHYVIRFPWSHQAPLE